MEIQQRKFTKSVDKGAERHYNRDKLASKVLVKILKENLRENKNAIQF